MIKDNKIRGYIFLLILILNILLMASTNNNSTPFIDRIYYFIGIPSWSGNGNGLHYTGFLSLFIIIICGIGIKINWQKVYPKISRYIIFFIMGVMILTFTAFNKGEKLYKYFQGDLNSIYCYKDDIELSYEKKDGDDKIYIECIIPVKNYSNEDLEFGISIENFSEVKEDKLVTTNLSGKEIIGLDPKEMKLLKLKAVGTTFEKDSSGSGWYSSFNFTIYNNNEKVEFLLDN
ncbi:hypothetical protein [Clostridiisalibacter paucivorans]|uniref:hypothetical protein n=1 Tax=Clostridiisalibacter paucivorans TaxID=408753 RepID=UPI000479DC39|nr:hypothetical protein [Clostridiisalibacter paucivorans]